MGGGRNYAYYRCIGTDAYRFGGERVCDNLQVRTDKLDQYVWQEVRALLQEPERLFYEYQCLQIVDSDQANNVSRAVQIRLGSLKLFWGVDRY